MSNVTRPPVGVTLSRETLEKLDEMAKADSRNRSREVEWLINGEWAGRRLGKMTVKQAISHYDELEKSHQAAVASGEPEPGSEEKVAVDPPASGPNVKLMADGDWGA